MIAYDDAESPSFLKGQKADWLDMARFKESSLNYPTQTDEVL